MVQPLLKAHQLPSPHLQQGQILASFALEHRLSLNDVSDGLASEANELATSSQVKVIIEQDKLPLSPHLATYAQRTNQRSLYVDVEWRRGFRALGYVAGFSVE